ncbi:MAG: glycosyltransferase family 87 protein [Kofleriaceae bacterium]
MKRPTALQVASIAVALAAAVLLGRMAVFLVDVDQQQLSIEPNDPWRTAHSCLSAYAEAARFAEEPGTNIYDNAVYEGRFIHGLKVDAYHYPPPFLLLPSAVQRMSGGYLAMRPVWFVLQLAALVGAMLMIASWLGPLRPRVLLAAPLLFIAPTTLFTLQMGNFQSTAVALSIIGMIALRSKRGPVQVAGGLALAFATLSKVFPGVLGVYLLAARRWRAALCTVGAGVVFVGVTLLVFGSEPFDNFIHFELPRLSSGEAFPQSELPRSAAINQSFYGLLVKLRTLGLTGLDIKTGLMLTSIYGVIVMVVAVAIAWRRRVRPEDRVTDVLVWLALLDLASFRSPFVGGAYGTIGTIWLLTIAIATASTLRGRLIWGACYLALSTATLLLPTPVDTPSHAMVAFSVAAHLLMIGVNGAVVARAWR